MLWNRQAETLPREQLDAVQLERLRQTIGRLLAQSLSGDGTAESARCEGDRDDCQDSHDRHRDADARIS